MPKLNLFANSCGVIWFALAFIQPKTDGIVHDSTFISASKSDGRIAPMLPLKPSFAMYDADLINADVTNGNIS